MGRIGDIRQWREYIFLELMKNESSLNTSPYKFFYLSQVEEASLHILFNVPTKVFLPTAYEQAGVKMYTPHWH